MKGRRGPADEVLEKILGESFKDGSMAILDGGAIGDAEEHQYEFEAIRDSVAHALRRASALKFVKGLIEPAFMVVPENRWHLLGVTKAAGEGSIYTAYQRFLREIPNDIFDDVKCGDETTWRYYRQLAGDKWATDGRKVVGLCGESDISTHALPYENYTGMAVNLKTGLKENVYLERWPDGTNVPTVLFMQGLTGVIEK